MLRTPIITVLLFFCLTSFCQEPGIVRIGNQIWMSKNLDIEYNDSYCYNNDTALCSVFGRLYNWNSANLVCPDGFRLPTDEDWAALSDTVGGTDIAGSKLLLGGTTGFNLLPGGNYNKQLNIFSYINRNAYFWTATPFNTGTAWMREFNVEKTNINRSTVKKEYYFSVRCIKE